MIKLRLTMEDTNVHIFWKKTLGVIETEVSKANFLTLFKNTALLSLDNDTATIAAPSTMIIDLIQKRFYNLLKTAIDKHAGKSLKIMFVPKNINSKNAQKEKNGPLFVEEVIQKSSAVNTISFLPRVRKDYVFETLAVSGGNQLAYISATTVAGNLGRSYNPLFIYGPVGVGKTHLMQAIANDAYKKNPTIKIIYITSEEFTNEVVEAIRTNQTHIMKKRFRTVKLLIIDDVQFIAGKDKVQEELFHTFNILIDNASQVVLSSDRPPTEIKKLEKRLSSRFSGGLTVDIEPPDFELRTAILLIKAKKYNIELPIEAAKYIAEKNQDTRSLEGDLLRVITESQTKREVVTVELAARVLGNSQENKISHLHPDDVIKKICLFYNIKPTQIKGERRDASLVRARQVAMYILKKEFGLAYVEIGNFLGGRDHTTIIHGVSKIGNLLSSNSRVSEEIVGISGLLRE